MSYTSSKSLLIPFLSILGLSVAKHQRTPVSSPAEHKELKRKKGLFLYDSKDAIRPISEPCFTR